MAKSSNQKKKILILAQCLLNETDENHPMKMKDILDVLERNGINAERKSIYDDIEVLKGMGMDILYKKDEPAGHYVASREFELAELKLLVDAVWSSRFITAKKSQELIKKLGAHTSRNNALKLSRQVMVSDRVKSMNESIFYSIDDIHNAISRDVDIEFLYYEWLPNKEMRARKGGEVYRISPWMLNWDDENYYLVGYDRTSEMIKYYRVDKMKDLKITEEKRAGKEVYEALRESDFIKSTFGMFAGEKSFVTLELDNHLAGVIIDRFGKDIFMHPIDEKRFKASVNVVVSNQFFSWLAGLGSAARIISPENVKADYIEYLLSILENYKM